jgi:hypothetical protein
MTDPGGGYGWRTGRHLPRQRGGIFSWGRMAEDEAARFRDECPLGVLLLPVELERFDQRARADDLLTAPGVVAVDPPRLAYGGMARVSETVADAMCGLQAKRLRLPGFPAALIFFHPDQYPLARALRDIHLDAELWYGPYRPPAGEREQALHDRAAERATMHIEYSDAPAHTQNLPLWERLETLGVESGRLGSERADIS